MSFNAENAVNGVVGSVVEERGRRIAIFDGRRGIPWEGRACRDRMGGSRLSRPGMWRPRRVSHRLIARRTSHISPNGGCGVLAAYPPSHIAHRAFPPNGGCGVLAAYPIVPSFRRPIHRTSRIAHFPHLSLPFSPRGEDATSPIFLSHSPHAARTPHLPFISPIFSRGEDAASPSPISPSHHFTTKNNKTTTKNNKNR